ncbi:hypothetical protein KFE25_000137 [Diacronema lutheri]|uniref:AP2/ERF domain-containing protein n=1 Tax=Diacronema lutheri TaxID=2081491 RepID=A0A8J5XNU1_DIALT|nr:hypothetical protein KFE25_000137 [Diacronema lutheri]
MAERLALALLRFGADEQAIIGAVEATDAQNAPFDRRLAACASWLAVREYSAFCAHATTTRGPLDAPEAIARIARYDAAGLGGAAIGALSSPTRELTRAELHTLRVRLTCSLAAAADAPRNSGADAVEQVLARFALPQGEQEDDLAGPGAALQLELRFIACVHHLRLSRFLAATDVPTLGDVRPRDTDAAGGASVASRAGQGSNGELHARARPAATVPMAASAGAAALASRVGVACAAKPPPPRAQPPTPPQPPQSSSARRPPPPQQPQPSSTRPPPPRAQPPQPSSARAPSLAAPLFARAVALVDGVCCELSGGRRCGIGLDEATLFFTSEEFRDSFKELQSVGLLQRAVSRWLDLLRHADAAARRARTAGEGAGALPLDQARVARELAIVPRLVKLVLDAVPCPDEPGRGADGSPLLFAVCQMKDFESPPLDVVRMLLERCDVDAVDADGTSPLAAACFDGLLDVAQVLLEHGASVNLADNDGLLPLHHACLAPAPKRAPHCARLIKMLLDARADATRHARPCGKSIMPWLPDALVAELAARHLRAPPSATAALLAWANALPTDALGLLPLQTTDGSDVFRACVVERARCRLAASAAARTSPTSAAQRMNDAAARHRRASLASGIGAHMAYRGAHELEGAAFPLPARAPPTVAGHRAPPAGARAPELQMAYKGVRFDAPNAHRATPAYRARISVHDLGYVHLGCFESASKAAEAYDYAARMLDKPTNFAANAALACKPTPTALARLRAALGMSGACADAAEVHVSTTSDRKRRYVQQGTSERDGQLRRRREGDEGTAWRRGECAARAGCSDGADDTDDDRTLAERARVAQRASGGGRTRTGAAEGVEDEGKARYANEASFAPAASKAATGEARGGMAAVTTSTSADLKRAACAAAHTQASATASMAAAEEVDDAYVCAAAHDAAPEIRGLDATWPTTPRLRFTTPRHAPFSSAAVPPKGSSNVDEGETEALLCLLNGR